MKRRLFLTLGALAAPAFVHASRPTRVLIVGAGAAGLTAARHLAQSGAEVHLLEAAPRWGGRIARLKGLADFPIDTGAEWIHGADDMLARIFDAPLPATISTMEYRPKTFQNWHKGRLRDVDAARLDYAERKFRTGSWYDAFDQMIVQSLGDSLHLKAQVTEIGYTPQGVVVTLQDGSRLEGDRVLVTVPLSVLQEGGIRFSPPLPKSVKAGLNDITFGSGYKLFLKFRDRFYPDVLIAGPLEAFINDSWTEATYYDAAFGKTSADHILGLFTTSDRPLPRAKLSDAALISEVLRELDSIYDGAATALYVQGHAQNWSKTDFINGSYSMENEGDTPIARLLAPIENRVFFAGEALGGADQATVQGAVFSAKRAVVQMLA